MENVISKEKALELLDCLKGDCTETEWAHAHEPTDCWQAMLDSIKEIKEYVEKN